MRLTSDQVKRQMRDLIRMKDIELRERSNVVMREAIVELFNTVSDALVDLMAGIPIEPTSRYECPEPAHYGADEYKCLLCARIWSRDEPRPDCQYRKG